MSVDASVEGMERFGEILGMMWGVEKDEGKLEGVLMRLFWAGLLNGGLGLWLVYGGRSARSLTWWGVWHAAVLGVTLWTCLGMQGWLFCVVFLVCGSWLTRVGKTVKIAEGTYEKRKGARGPENVWGAGLVPALCAMMFTVCSIFPSFSIYAPIASLAFVASLSTKMWDTTASEIGKAYGKTTILITSFKVVPRGTEGAISLEGTVAGTLVAAAYALLAVALHLIPFSCVFLVSIAAFFANFCESLIGAELQEPLKLSNEVVNVINSCIGAGSAVTLYLITR